MLFCFVLDNFDGPIRLFQDYENNRKRWLLTNRELMNRDQIIGELKQENQVLKLRLDSIRAAYTREIRQKDQLQKDYNELRKKLTMVQELLNEERSGGTRPSSQQSVLSVLSDLNKLPSTSQFNMKSKYNDANESDDGLLFDKSDDTLEDMDTDDHRTTIKMPRLEPVYAQVNFDKKTSSRSSLIPQSQEPTQVKSTANLNLHKHPSTIAEEEEEDENDLLNVGFISNEKILDFPMDSDSDKGTLYSSPSSLAKSVSVATVNRRRSGKLMSKFNLMRNASKLEPERLHSRSHTFQSKKAFKPLTCGPCGKSIGFCSSCLVCVDCRGVVHQRCQDQLPKPCIPYVTSGAGLKKMLSSAGPPGFFAGNHMVMISDFTTHNARPCVPALLVHCCNELDRRIDLALNDPKGVAASPVVGLYRSRILDGKNGIPNLTTVTDPHVICGVIKFFLRDLDDPLVTRILWNDFVRAAGKFICFFLFSKS